MVWQIEKIKFLLSHIEGFIDRDLAEIRERAETFSAETGLEKIENLLEPATPDENPLRVLDRLTPFFDGGLLLQDWRVTDVLWKGTVFHLDASEQMNAETLKTDASPSQIVAGPAQGILKSLDLECLSPGPNARGFLVKPTPQVGFVLITDLAEPWIEDHIRHAHRLINKAFVY